MIDPWSVCYKRPRGRGGKRRFLRPLTWVRRDDPDDNGYARPVEGLIVRFDLDRMEVVDIEDHGVVPLPSASGNYTAEGIRDAANVPHFPDGPRQDLKPVEITQPDGVSFTVDGHEVHWQKWRFRVGFTPREGLVLYLVGYEDRGTLRPVMYRASLAEMFIPYGDPNPAHYRKNVFDMGEYGIGVLANSLEPGCDCLGDRQDRGPALAAAGDLDDRHRRELRVRLLLVPLPGRHHRIRGQADRGDLQRGPAPWAAAGPRHAGRSAGLRSQPPAHLLRTAGHDGRRPGNTVYECDSVAVPPGPQNPHGNAWVVRQTPLRRESEAQRVADGRAARYWKIANPGRRNATGEPVAYKLMPRDGVLPFGQPGSGVMQRAQFATRHLWVTAYDPDQRFPAGEYPNQHPGGDGLPAWTAADRPLENTDLVLWHKFTAHHVVRPEDWPVMPVTTVGFQLRADGFFDGNPALDLPPEEHCHHQG
jgi:primary-amine oxidase